MRLAAVVFALIIAAGCAAAKVPQFMAEPLQPNIYETKKAVQPARENYLRHEDPSLVTLANSGQRTKRFVVDGEPGEGARIAPGEKRSFYFFLGKHRFRITTERVTAIYGSWDVSRTIEIEIRADGLPKIFYLYD